mgnify:CR=1 FL=1
MSDSIEKANKKTASLREQRDGQKSNDFMLTDHIYDNINRLNSQEEGLFCDAS